MLVTKGQAKKQVSNKKDRNVELKQINNDSHTKSHRLRPDSSSALSQERPAQVDNLHSKPLEFGTERKPKHHS